MPPPEPGPEWVLSGVALRSDSTIESELIKAARSAWPTALAHVRQVQSNKRFDDDGILVAEVWEGVLRSVSRTLDRMNGRRGEIQDLEAYLLGTFYHRLSRALRKEQRREETIHLVSSVQELEVLGTVSQADAEQDIEGGLQAQEILQRMDPWSRKVWVAREYGYTWKHIGQVLGIPGDSVMLRFRRRMMILRARLSGGR
jgi:DNA-directed RNA polymerase specialized sigma24 family protein